MQYLNENIQHQICLCVFVLTCMTINNIKKISKWIKSLKNRTNRTLDRRWLFVANVVAYPRVRTDLIYNTTLSAKRERCKILRYSPFTGLLCQKMSTSGPRVDTGQETPLRGRCCDIPSCPWRCPL